jgi:hypothetical protein
MKNRRVRVTMMMKVKLHLLALLVVNVWSLSPRRTIKRFEWCLTRRGGEEACDAGSGSDGILDHAETNDPAVKLLRETVLWRGKWRSVFQRAVHIPGAKQTQIEFDVLSSNHGDESVFVVAWDSASCTATLIREYHPGPNEWQFGVVAGGYEGKHATPLDAAQSELEEEARMIGGTWVPLVTRQGAGSLPISQDKYTTAKFHVYLVVDARAVDDQEAADLKAPDDEESIRVVHGVSVERLYQLIQEAKINVPSSYAIFMALRKLSAMGLLASSE